MESCHYAVSLSAPQQPNYDDEEGGCERENDHPGPNLAQVLLSQFPAEKGPPHRVWEAYGRGVSMFVSTAMKDGKPDRFGNRDTTFNPNRLGFNVAKTGLWQRVRFEDVVAAARNTARQLGWPLSTAAKGTACGTTE